MDSPRVKVSQGELQGVLARTMGGARYCSFRGVPYAEPPLGQLRFKAPVPIQPWTGIKDATEEGSPSAQCPPLISDLAGNEDCLFLNVYTPSLPDKSGTQPGKLLPVMVYIHGGGFVYGSNRVEEFGPDFIVEKDTVLVSINYRLGVFGFLCLDIPEAPGNAGLKDQTLALQWVQQNIHNFNGDCNNVTIFGISAGSASVEYHLVSSMSSGLFKKAILQSGSSMNPWARTQDPTKLAEKLANKLELVFTDHCDLLKKLKNIGTKDMVVAASKIQDFELINSGELFNFVPVVEKSFKDIIPFINVEPLELLKAGKFNKVPTLSGICENEGALFKTFYGSGLDKMKNENYIDYLPKSFNVDRTKFNEVLKTIYNENKTSKDDVTGVDEFLSDVLFVGGIYVSLKNRLKYAGNDKLYHYRFSYDGGLNFIKIMMKLGHEKGAMHGDDTTYLATSSMHIKEEDASDKDRLVRSRMVQMWTDFAKTGNPTPESEQWKPVTLGENVKLLEISYEPSMMDMSWNKRMQLWEQLYNDLYNM